MANYIPSRLPHFKAPATLSGSGSVVQPVDTGYDIAAIRLQGDRRAKALKHANGTLSNGSHKVVFFAEELAIDIGLSGTTGQGRRKRDFYAHNLIMPMYKVIGQCLDQMDYATLVEFIHSTQQDAVGNINADNFIQLDITGGGLPGGQTNRALSGRMKGVHKPVVVQGYIEKIQRIHEHATYAPAFTFDMAVADALPGGMYEDQNFVVEARSWHEILQDEVAFSQAPTQAIKNSKTVANATVESFVKFSNDTLSALETLQKSF